MSHSSEKAGKAFQWPHGTRAALSFSFDDARTSQVDRAVPILDRHGAKGTFYVSLSNVEACLPAWKEAAAAGHEIGNHSLHHPCSGNFTFARGNPLEDYTLERMERELLEANDAVQQALGVRPSTFAYPCGQTFVGRGEGRRSYVPVVARHFVVGRHAFDETHNHPLYCDLACATSLDLDRADLAAAMRLIEAAVADGGWLIFMSHDVGDGGRQTTLAPVLDGVCRYARDPANGLWLDTVAAVGAYMRVARGW